MPTCTVCGEWKDTLQGIKSHMSQSKHCLKKQSERQQQDPGEELDADVGIGPLDNNDVPIFEFEAQLGGQGENGGHEKLVPTAAEPVRGRKCTHAEMEAPTWYDPLHLYGQDYPRLAGTPLRPTDTAFEMRQRVLRETRQEPWVLFGSVDQWDLARWLTTSGLSHKKIDEFLHLKIVREKINPPYKTSRAFFQHIDALPRGPAWKCTPMTVTGDELGEDGKPRVESLELWHRDPVECVAELLGNPLFAKEMKFAPERVFRKPDQTQREYDEMWTADWWWETQDLLPEKATIAPVILASDQTQLSNFSGDKKAWPVYLTLGNIAKSTRRQPSSRATILLAYLPVAKLDCFSAKRRSVQRYQVFHDCMRVTLRPLVPAGESGVNIACGDGWERNVFPLYAAHIADYPEQCLICGIMENSCGECHVHPKKRGSREEAAPRTQKETVRILSAQSVGLNPEEFKEWHLRPVNPYWADLPHCDINQCMTPDLLHQLHKGVFSDHLSKWATASMDGNDEGRKQELDRRFRTMPRHPTLRHFTNGTSAISQWTGNEYRSLAKVFLGTIVDSVHPDVVGAMRHLFDFMEYAHFEVHTDDSLAAMEHAWNRLHDYLPVFERLGLREHFNISKLHNICHYISRIRSRGTADGFNSEHTERLHIDLAKNGYRASNHKDYVRQMTQWLTRQESVHNFTVYLQWYEPRYTPGRGLGLIANKPAPDVGEEDEHERERDDDAVDGDSDERPEEEEEEEEAVQDTRRPYTIAINPAYPKLSASDIESRFGIRDFLYYVEDFMQKNSIQEQQPLSPAAEFNAYKQVTLSLPVIRQAKSEKITDTVHAILKTHGSISDKGIKRGSPAKFSTVLVRISERKWEKGALSGLQVAHVRLIFKPPTSYSSFEHPLLYVHWFTPFRDALGDFEKGAGFSRINHSTTQGQRRAAVISLHDVVQTCHLIPQFGQAVDPKWTTETVLTQASKFYFYPYLRHREFYLFRFNMHSVAQHHKLKAEQLARQRARGIHSRR